MQPKKARSDDDSVN